MRISQYLQIGKTMKEIRKKANISQGSMAERLHLKDSSYSNYENGYSEPSIEVLQLFCKILGISVEQFLQQLLEKKDRGEKGV